MMDDYVEIFIANCNDTKILLQIMRDTLDRLELITQEEEEL